MGQVHTGILHGTSACWLTETKKKDGEMTREGAVGRRGKGRRARMLGGGGRAADAVWGPAVDN